MSLGLGLLFLAYILGSPSKLPLNVKTEGGLQPMLCTESSPSKKVGLNEPHNCSLSHHTEVNTVFLTRSMARHKTVRDIEVCRKSIRSCLCVWYFFGAEVEYPKEDDEPWYDYSDCGNAKTTSVSHKKTNSTCVCKWWGKTQVESEIVYKRKTKFWMTSKNTLSLLDEITGENVPAKPGMYPTPDGLVNVTSEDIGRYSPCDTPYEMSVPCHRETYFTKKHDGIAWSVYHCKDGKSNFNVVLKQGDNADKRVCSEDNKNKLTWYRNSDGDYYTEVNPKLPGTIKQITKETPNNPWHEDDINSVLGRMLTSLRGAILEITASECRMRRAIWVSLKASLALQPTLTMTDLLGRRDAIYSYVDGVLWSRPCQPIKNYAIMNNTECSHNWPLHLYNSINSKILTYMTPETYLVTTDPGVTDCKLNTVFKWKNKERGFFNLYNMVKITPMGDPTELRMDWNIMDSEERFAYPSSLYNVQASYSDSVDGILAQIDNVKDYANTENGFDASNDVSTITNQIKKAVGLATGLFSYLAGKWKHMLFICFASISLMLVIYTLLRCVLCTRTGDRRKIIYAPIVKKRKKQKQGADYGMVDL